MAALGGIQPWAADAANAIPLFIFTLTLLRLFAGFPFGLTLAAVVICLSIPIFGLAIVEFQARHVVRRAYGTWHGTNSAPRPREIREGVYAGLAFAASLLMKPTFAPLVVTLFVTAFVLRFAPELRSAEGRILAARSLLIIGGTATMLAGPYFLLVLEHWLIYRVNVLAPKQPSGHRALI